MSIMSAFFRSQGPDWRTFYRAAILEPDISKVPGRIAEAKKEIVQRARDLFQENRNNIEEAQALDSAMCTLQVFRSTLKRDNAGSSNNESKAV
jgi:hypothetical protein